MTAKKILITGAYGLIGNLTYQHLSQLSDAYLVYGLDRNDEPSNRIAAVDATIIPPQRFGKIDLTDMAGMQTAVQGMEAVVHMAADAGSGDWDSLLRNNIIGVKNLFEACHSANVKRLVFASSVMVNFGYFAEEPFKAIREGHFEDVPADFQPLTHLQPPRPTTDYAATKLFGEALAYRYAHNYGMSILCLRIGWVVAENRPRPKYGRSAWCSFRDICQLIQKCLEAPEDLRFDIFHGISNNRYGFVDLEHARDILGYHPQDSAEDFTVDENP